MVGLVFRHELVAVHAVEDRVHDRPLRRRKAPSALGFLVRQPNDPTATDVHVEGVTFDVNPTPDELARLADALQRRSAAGEVHGWLALTHGTGIAVDKVTGRCSARDFEDPHELVDTVGANRFTPPDIVQGRRWVKSELHPHPIGQ